MADYTNTDISDTDLVYQNDRFKTKERHTYLNLKINNDTIRQVRQRTNLSDFVI